MKAAPNPIQDAGFNPPYSDDSSIHFGVHGPFSDERVNFPGKMLHAGKNTITIQMDARSGTAYLMVDYLRLELTGHVPPAPPSVAAYAGNNRVLVCWPAVPGATSYTILRSSAAGAGPVPIVTGYVGPVCGSGPGMVTYTDATAINGTEYRYAVQSVNPTGQSVASTPSAGATPLPSFSSNVPPAPEGLHVTRLGHHLVALDWTSSPGANSYTVRRTTLHSDGVGGTYPVGTVILDDAITDTHYTDRSPTDGRMYSYQVEATSAAGTSEPSVAAVARPLPDAPASAPQGLAGHWIKTRNGNAITLNWSPVPGAIGYVIYRATGAKPSFKWPENFLTVLVETTYTDKGSTEKKAAMKGLDDAMDYSYQVTAVNAAGISPPTSVRVTAR